MKTCVLCEKTLPLSEFWRHRKAKDGLQYRCKSCVTISNKQSRDKNPNFREEASSRNREWRKNNLDKSNGYSQKFYHANKDKAREYERKTQYRRSLNRKAREYGITVGDFNRWLDAQGGVCAICGKENKERRSLNVDHCHETGEIRGLLCGPCNKALGAFGDNAEGVRKALKYVEESRTGMFVSEKRRKMDLTQSRK